MFSPPHRSYHWVVSGHRLLFSVNRAALCQSGWKVVSAAWVSLCAVVVAAVEGLVCNGKLVCCRGHWWSAPTPLLDFYLAHLRITDNTGGGNANSSYIFVEGGIYICLQNSSKDSSCNQFSAWFVAFLTSWGGIFKGTFGLRRLKPWAVFQCECTVVAACQRVRATKKYEVFTTMKGWFHFSHLLWCGYGNKPDAPGSLKNGKQANAKVLLNCFSWIIYLYDLKQDDLQPLFSWSSPVLESLAQ